MGVYQAFTVSLILEFGIAVAPNIDEPDDLVIAQVVDWAVDAPQVKPEPVVVRFAVGPNPESVRNRQTRARFPDSASVKRGQL